MACRRCPRIAAGRLVGAGLCRPSGCLGVSGVMATMAVGLLAKKSPCPTSMGRPERRISPVLPMGVGRASPTCPEACLMASLWSSGTVGSRRETPCARAMDGGRSRAVDVPSPVFRVVTESAKRPRRDRFSASGSSTASDGAHAIAESRRGTTSRARAVGKVRPIRTTTVPVVRPTSSASFLGQATTCVVGRGISGAS